MNNWESLPHYPAKFRPIYFIDNVIEQVESIIEEIERDDYPDYVKDVYDTEFPHKTFLAWLISIRDSNLVPEELFRVYTSSDILSPVVCRSIYKKIFLEYGTNQISPGTRDMYQAINGKYMDQYVDVCECCYRLSPDDDKLTETICGVMEYSTNSDISGTKYMMGSSECDAIMLSSFCHEYHSHEKSTAGWDYLYDTISFF